MKWPKKKRLNITEIEDNLSKLVNADSKEGFISAFVSSYDIPRTSITRANRKFHEGHPFIIKNKLYYFETKDDVVKGVDTIQQKVKEDKSQPRFIVVNNFKNFAVLDTKTMVTLNILFTELPQHADFFLPWNGVEKADYQAESPADRKAAERFARLYDILAKDNLKVDEHSFNLFLTRLLFLLFAEDTNIMPKGIFTNTLKTRTKEDGSDLNEVITTIFSILDISKTERVTKENWLSDFPYVNGNFFKEEHSPLFFTSKSRKLIIEAGELLNWQEINPDILGSMIQSVASAENRHVTGMHYTSVPNIMKVIKPLFLDELTNVFESLKQRFEQNNEKNITEKTRKINCKDILNSLNKLHERIASIKFLDPASGSGNFLIITYKEIRRLEIRIILLEQEIELSDQMPMSSIHLNNFSGIEIDDFAHEVAKISLWIAEHQMNEEMESAIPGTITQLLPLKDAGNIIIGNALRIDWNKIVPHTLNDEIYIMGNPPYGGSSKQNKMQKADITSTVGKTFKKYKEIDYIAGWFYLGAQFISNFKKAKLAFVSTNSIAQGNQVELFQPIPEYFNVEIGFAYNSFKWANSARNNAGVTVVIVSYRNFSSQDKTIFSSDGTMTRVNNINSYLTDGENIIVHRASKSISELPKMNDGNNDRSYGGLLFNEQEYHELISHYPILSKYFVGYVGGKEFINSIPRYAIVLDEDEYLKVKNIAELSKRFELVKQKRLEAKDSTLQRLATQPWRFRDTNPTSENTILIPYTSSENRDYLPAGIVGKSVMPSAGARVIYNAPVWLLGLLESRMHMVWLRSVGGKLKTDYRYSAGLVYNTFPIQNLSTQRKNEMKRVMIEILELREYLGGTLAELYNKKTMPEVLRKKHEELDGIVDRAYQQRPFESDEDRLSMLLNLYQKMTDEEG
jgi:hypothetical protein